MRLFSECSENPQQFCFHGLLLAFFVVIGLILLFAFLLHYFKKYGSWTINIFMDIIFVFFRNNRDSTILRPNSFFRPSNPSSRALPRCTIKQPQNFKMKIFSESRSLRKRDHLEIDHFENESFREIVQFENESLRENGHLVKNRYENRSLCEIGRLRVDIS